MLPFQNRPIVARLLRLLAYIITCWNCSRALLTMLLGCDSFVDLSVKHAITLSYDSHLSEIFVCIVTTLLYNGSGYLSSVDPGLHP